MNEESSQILLEDMNLECLFTEKNSEEIIYQENIINKRDKMMPKVRKVDLIVSYLFFPFLYVSEIFILVMLLHVNNKLKKEYDIYFIFMMATNIVFTIASLISNLNNRGFLTGYLLKVSSDFFRLMIFFTSIINNTNEYYSVNSINNFCFRGFIKNIYLYLNICIIAFTLTRITDFCATKNLKSILLSFFYAYILNYYFFCYSCIWSNYLLFIIVLIILKEYYMKSKGQILRELKKSYEDLYSWSLVQVLSTCISYFLLFILLFNEDMLRYLNKTYQKS
ncbi:hypothetical protein H312_00057 [Anncaliia algerae PRA339]|uniref:Uncharacterized protein n=1 Tax=Anncaliia algerae PRA339 TaxID=1288291 RepID=A0A059F5W2_9MICR|nr:hypothetical protein H312_00057 [Anncaliia algerae PRA339]